MKIKIFTVTLFSVLCIIFYSGCGSSEFESERASMPDSTGIAGNNEIKKEIAKPKQEIREDFQKQETTVVSKPPLKTYTVQIGAYGVESNAMDILKDAQSLFGKDVYYDLNGTVYKIRVGKYGSIEEALELLSRIKQNGYIDAFVTEVGK